MATTKKPSVDEVCQQGLAAHFESRTFETPVLKPFDVGDKSLLSSLIRAADHQPFIPVNPAKSSRPCLLLYDLENAKHKDNLVYKHIDYCKGKQPSALYATSGAGKTRSIFEYMSQNYGLYFVAHLVGDTTVQVGSTDLMRLLTRFECHGKATSPTQNPEELEGEKEISNANLRVLKQWIQAAIIVRSEVFKYINKLQLELGAAELTPFQWLMVQLYPDQFLGSDLFDELTKSCIKRCSWRSFNNYDFKKWGVTFIDEAQQLKERLPSLFLSADGTKQRAAFSAVLRAYTDIARGETMGYPVFSGTGMSFESFKEQTASASIMVKDFHFHEEKKSSCFTAFKPLTAEAVETYLALFLQLDNLDIAVKTHVAKWLRGRPRWTASFLEVYSVRPAVTTYHSTKGQFEPKEAKLMQALDRYINVITTDESDASDNRGISWQAGAASAFHAVKIVMNASGGASKKIQDCFERAVFLFAVGGKPSLISVHTKELIEIGVAAVSATQGAPPDCDFIGVLDEPIIIQAALNLFKLDTMVQRNLQQQEPGGQGEAFEKLMLPALQRHAQDLLKSQLGNNDDGIQFGSYDVSSKSSYGVLALDCKTAPEKTVEWIEAATSASFEGQVPPFCYPDDNFGPDVLFLMWDLTFTNSLSVLSQAKFRPEFPIDDALRTLVPELLYHKNRKTTPVPTTNVKADVLKRWNAVKHRLIGDRVATTNEQVCIRLMVQYPRNETPEAKPGKFHEQNRCDETKNSCKKKHDFLATVSVENGPTLFGPEAINILNYLKGSPKQPKRRKAPT
jgi:hypothetical protein